MTKQLDFTGKTILVMGTANKKSVAYHIGKLLTEAGAETVVKHLRDIPAVIEAFGLWEGADA